MENTTEIEEQMRNSECGIRNEDTDENSATQVRNSEFVMQNEDAEENGAQGEIEVKDAQSDINDDTQMRNSECGTVLSQMRNSEFEMRNEENCFGTDGNDADGLKAESAPQGSWDSAWEVEMEKQKRIQAENKFECLRYLDEKGLPLSLIDVIGEGSLEKMKGAIDSLLQIITSRVRDEVKSRLVSVTPPPSKTISPSYADFQKMSLGEMQKIYSTNRMLYNELTQNNKK